MDTSQAPHPETPDDWIEVAIRDRDNIKGTYLGKVSNDRKIDCALSAVEALLKAILWKKRKWNRWPSKGSEPWLYHHKLNRILKETGLEGELLQDPERAASWRAIVNAAHKKYVYSRVQPTNAVANSVSRSVRHPDLGVFEWLLKRYIRMT